MTVTVFTDVVVLPVTLVLTFTPNIGGMPLYGHMHSSFHPLFPYIPLWTKGAKLKLLLDFVASWWWNIN